VLNNPEDPSTFIGVDGKTMGLVEYWNSLPESVRDKLLLIDRIRIALEIPCGLRECMKQYLMMDTGQLRERAGELTQSVLEDMGMPSSYAEDLLKHLAVGAPVPTSRDQYGNITSTIPINEVVPVLTAVCNGGKSGVVDLGFIDDQRYLNMSATAEELCELQDGLKAAVQLQLDELDVEALRLMLLAQGTTIPVFGGQGNSSWAKPALVNHFSINPNLYKRFGKGDHFNWTFYGIAPGELNQFTANT